MIYDDLILHQSQWNRLSVAFTSGRLAHAYLFHGPAGSGKEAHAIELAALVNCTKAGSNGACGVCPSCIKFKNLQHPNLQLVLPLPRRNAVTKSDPPLKALNSNDIDSLIEQQALKATQPYYKINMDGASSILINSVRELRRTSHLRQAEDGWRAILLFEAEKLCIPQPTAGNALLKLLEEPPPQTIIILVTDRPNLLLDTLRSRCLSLFFPQLPGLDISRYMVENRGVTPETARLLAEATNGNLVQALQLVDENIDPDSLISPLISSIITPQPKSWQQLVDSLANSRRRKPLEFIVQMQLFQLWLRDLMLLSINGKMETLIFSTQEAKLRGCLELFPNADWGMCTELLEQALTSLDRNINPGLVFTNLFLNLRDIMRGNTDPGLLVDA
ncbi:ATP-binding protein [Candidatus Neomarinimicrobiota bacterium]